MRDFKIAFLLPVYFGSNHSIFLGVGYLASAVKSKGDDAIVIDEDAIHWIYSNSGVPQAYDSTKKRIISEIQKYAPDVLCMYINTANYRNALNMLKYVRANFPQIFMVVGGPHISTCYSTFKFWHEDLYDAALIGEGEVALPCLIENLKKGKLSEFIPGICYSGSPVFYNPAPMVNVDRLPFPDREAFFYVYTSEEKILAESNYRRVFYAHLPGFEKIHGRIVISRGCYNSCAFCSPGVYWRNPKNLQPCRRVRNAKSVVNEIEHLILNGVSAVYFDDPTFPIKSDLKFFDEFEREILNRSLKFNWGAPICMSEVDFNLLDRLKNIGFTYAYFGLENYKLSALNKFNKNQNIRRGIDLIMECKLRGIHCDASYQIGLPGEKSDDIKRSIDWIFQNRIERNTFYSITAIWPATKLAEEYNVLPKYYEPEYDKKFFEQKSGLYFYEQGNSVIEQFYSNCSETYHFIPVDLAIEIKYYIFDRGLTNRFQPKAGDTK